MSIRIGIYGYGNLGRGVEAAITQNPDMTLVGVFTRRDPSSVKTQTGAPVFHTERALSMKEVNCTNCLVCHRYCFGIGQFGNAEIHHLYASVFKKHNVLRLDISVNYIISVCLAERS